MLYLPNKLFMYIEMHRDCITPAIYSDWRATMDTGPGLEEPPSGKSHNL